MDVFIAMKERRAVGWKPAMCEKALYPLRVAAGNRQGDEVSASRVQARYP
ncbi:MAG: hypothetical protein H0Z34_11920 [Brevibacillus sp.]|nr:hypothetical protein [Brevibacillus sp.]